MIFIKDEIAVGDIRESAVCVNGFGDSRISGSLGVNLLGAEPKRNFRNSLG